jgi:hypothetical protein
MELSVTKRCSPQLAMDVPKLLSGPRARAKDAEALAILTRCSHPATQMLDRAKQEYGSVLGVSQMGMFIDPAAEELYKIGKKNATRLLFDGYAEIVFSELLDPESFIAALIPIRTQVETTLPVIDAHQADLCRLEWTKLAWDRGAPNALRRFLKKWMDSWQQAEVGEQQSSTPVKDVPRVIRTELPLSASSNEDSDTAVTRDQFPKRASWLQDRLLERGWGNPDPAKWGGPDRKTVEKMLRGEGVRSDVLLKLAEALSKRGDKIDVLNIPQD